MSAQERVIVTVHGIRTFGQWQDRLKTLLLASDKDIVVANYSYGYFSVIAFVIPIFRWLAVRAFRQKLRGLVKKHNGARFSFVAHSFGTHLVANALSGMKPEELPDIDLVLLSGSVLRSSFDWEPLMQADPPNGRGIRRVINDCGLNDSVLILSQAAVLFTGMAGRVGFYGFSGLNVSNRFFHGGHSHYFAPPGSDRNAFMTRYWVPVLAKGEVPEPGIEIPAGSTLEGVQHTLFRLADPIKLTAYGVLGFLLLNYAYLQPRAEARLEQARRQFNVAASQMVSVRTVPEAFESAASILARDLPEDGSDHRRADILARFALQRLMTAAQAVERLPKRSVFSWSDFNYLAAPKPVRLSIETPIAEVGDSGVGRSLVIDRNSALSIIDKTSGEILKREWPDENGDINSPIAVFRLANAKDQFLIRYFTEAANDDESRDWDFWIDLSTIAIENANRNLLPSEDCKRFEHLPNLSIQNEDDDGPPLSDEEKAAQQAEAKRRQALREKCLVSNTPTPVPALGFPRATPEQTSWSARPFIGPPLPEDLPCPLAGTPHFPFKVRVDAARLDFSKLPREAEWIDEETAKQIFQGGDFGERACFIEFEGSDGKLFIATLGFVAEWHVTWLFCSMTSDVVAKACTTTTQNWDASGDLWLSPDRSLLAVADRGLSYRSAWHYLDLETMLTHEPDRSANSRTIAIAFDGDTLMAISPARAGNGGIEVWSYDVGNGARLRARRVFALPEDYTPPAEDGDSWLDETTLFESDGNVVLATAFQFVAALDHEYYSDLPGWITDAVGALQDWTGRAAPVDVADGIVTPWAIPETGLDPKGPVKIKTSPNRDILAVASGSSIRLIQANSGQFLTTAMDVWKLPNCSGAIQSIAIRSDLGLTVTTETCVATRAPPPSSEVLSSQLADLSNYLGGGTQLSRVLPGEVFAPGYTLPAQSPLSVEP